MRYPDRVVAIFNGNFTLITSSDDSYHIWRRYGSSWLSSNAIDKDVMKALHELPLDPSEAPYVVYEQKNAMGGLSYGHFPKEKNN